MDNGKEGVLTHGIEPEEFTRKNFEKHCKNVRNFIIKKGARKKISSENKEWLNTHVYQPVYNKLMNFVEKSSNLEEIPPTPWKDLEPIAKLKTEPEIAELLKDYEREIEKWKRMFLEIKDGFTTNERQLGDIIKPAFAAAGMINRNEMITLTENSSQEPRSWITAFKIILFDDTIDNSEILYAKLLKFSEDSNNGLKQSLLYWKQHFPNIFGYILERLPALRKNLRVNVTHEQLSKQREYLHGIIQRIISVLEEKLK